MPAEAIHLMFSANRWETNKQIIQLLTEGNNIICDRYAYSGVSYSSAKGLDIEWCKNADRGLPRPDLVFFLYANEEILEKRGSFGKEIYEKKEF